MTLIGLQRVVKRWAGKAECCSRSTHRPAVNVHTPQHFIFDLQQITCIEEIVLLKQTLFDTLRVWIQRIVSLECLALGSRVF